MEDADPKCHAQHQGKEVFDEVVAVRGDALQWVLVHVKEGLEGRSFETPQAPVVLDQQGCVYRPRVFGAMVNQPIEIRNSDPTMHNVHSYSRADAEGHGDRRPAGRCELHASRVKKEKGSDPARVLTPLLDTHPAPAKIPRLSRPSFVSPSPLSAYVDPGRGNPPAPEEKSAGPRGGVRAQSGAAVRTS